MRRLLPQSLHRLMFLLATLLQCLVVSGPRDAGLCVLEYLNASLNVCQYFLLDLSNVPFGLTLSTWLL